MQFVLYVVTAILASGPGASSDHAPQVVGYETRTFDHSSLENCSHARAYVAQFSAESHLLSAWCQQK
jgi:hypothetical protein